MQEKVRFILFLNFSSNTTVFSEAFGFDSDNSLWVYSRNPLYQQGTTSGVYYNDEKTTRMD